MDQFVALGKAPRPTTSQELERRLLEVLVQAPIDDGTQATGREAITVSAVLLGADIQSLVVDASGLELVFPMDLNATDAVPDQTEAGPDDDSDEDAVSEVARREPAVVRRATLRALPVVLQGIAVDLEASVQNVPFEWLESTHGRLAVAPREPSARGRRRPSRVNVDVGVDPDTIFPALIAPIREEAAASGFHLSREKLSLRQLGPRRVRLGLRARARWKFLAATFRFRVEIHVDGKYVLRPRRPKLSSSNPILAALLVVFRGRINREFREAMPPVDLNAALAPSQLRTLRIRAGRRLQVQVELRP